MKSDKEKDKYVLGKIEPHQNEMFKNVEICRSACKGVIREVVAHYEDNIAQERELWRLINKQFETEQEDIQKLIDEAPGGNFSEWHLTLNHDNGEVSMVRKNPIDNLLRRTVRDDIEKRWMHD